MDGQVVVALGLSIAALLTAVAAALRARADGQLAKFKAASLERERNADILVARTEMEAKARERADEVENRLFARFEQEAKLNADKIDHLDTLYRETRHELDTAQAELKRAEERSLLNREDLEAAKIRINTLERSLREVTKSWQAAEGRVKELETINTQLKDERDLLNAQIAQMGKEISTLTTRESELTEKVNKLEKSFQMIQHAQVLGAAELVEEILEEVKGMKESTNEDKPE